MTSWKLMLHETQCQPLEQQNDFARIQTLNLFGAASCDKSHVTDTQIIIITLIGIVHFYFCKSLNEPPKVQHNRLFESCYGPFRMSRDLF